MCLKVLYFCLIISSLTLGQVQFGGRPNVAQVFGSRPVFRPNVTLAQVFRPNVAGLGRPEDKDDGINCDTCCNKIEKIINRLQNSFETKMTQIQTQLANMNYQFEPDTTY